MRECPAQACRDLRCLAGQRARHEGIFWRWREAEPDDCSEHVERLTLRHGVRRPATGCRNLGHDRHAAQALEIPSVCHTRRDPLAAEGDEDSDEERGHERKRRVAHRPRRSRLARRLGAPS
jgi:hypothetical protein